ncbi:hypothetical protein H310_06312 [Aphanomyces invadans]|uniref:Uncharacterized protein n=1 Tax=Aphanomyces invadans TaxID=157072 RepID=A0A024U5K4_9STRA|nr:hypothetical protein H310_06312 [Aphanomyces invadans]ETW01696.1 hypothetical protein H310_06312 [Aphanomyces invadans]|eukprot:XP_008869544.1 hypothetical protein H310_06312 [Aphanomyces invadans]
MPNPWYTFWCIASLSAWKSSDVLSTWSSDIYAAPPASNVPVVMPTMSLTCTLSVFFSTCNPSCLDRRRVIMSGVTRMRHLAILTPRLFVLIRFITIPSLPSWRTNSMYSAS